MIKLTLIILKLPKITVYVTNILLKCETASRNPLILFEYHWAYVDLANASLDYNYYEIIPHPQSDQTVTFLDITRKP